MVESLDGEWVTLCDDENDVRVICRQLGNRTEGH